MIITCPHCRTKYQVTYEAIGSAGRKVQCAHCRQAWQQQPIATPDAPDAVDSDIAGADILFDAMAEDALDEVFEAEAASQAKVPANEQPPAPAKTKPADATALKKQQAAFSRRQNAMISRLPLARLRRSARAAGIVVLVGLLAGAYFGRVAIVERYPDLAGVYEALGLGVNVVGLDFSSLQTLKTLSSGKDVLLVSAQIVGQTPRPVEVPPVVVRLLDADNHAVYEWSVLPRVRNLMAGERATFDTRLTLPPTEAVKVRLTFAGSNWGEASQTANGPQPQMPAATEDAPAPAPHSAPEPDAPHAAAAEHH